MLRCATLLCLTPASANAAMQCCNAAIHPEDSEHYIVQGNRTRHSRDARLQAPIWTGKQRLGTAKIHVDGSVRIKIPRSRRRDVTRATRQRKTSHTLDLSRTSSDNGTVTTKQEPDEQTMERIVRSTMSWMTSDKTEWIFPFCQRIPLI